MAYAALLSLSNSIHLILTYHQDSIFPAAKHEITTISEHVTSMQAFLEDSSEEWRRYEAMIRAVVHAAEDIIEGFVSCHVYEPRQNRNLTYSFSEKAQNLEELIWEARHGEDGSEEKSYDLFEFITQTELKNQPSETNKHIHYNIQELKEAKDEIKALAKSMMKIKNSTISTPSSQLPSPQNDDDLVQIIYMLCEEQLSVLEILGVGCRNLSLRVYSATLIMEHFDICAWVTVSQDRRLREIVSSINVDEEEEEVQQRFLMIQGLKGGRFLVVLDDVWSREVWDEYKLMFPEDGNGSRVMLATRLQEAASDHAASCCLVHEMYLLDKDQCLDLLWHTQSRHDPCPTTLERIGGIIARRSRELPLAIRLVSGIMSNADRPEAAWNIIAEAIKPTIHTNQEQLAKILSLSYAVLPRHLRTCLLYAANFGKHCTTRASELISLWIAEGFLKPSYSKTFEETGEECLEDLVKRGLVLVVKRNTNGRINRFIIHDLIREICVKESEEENFIRRYLHEDRKISSHSVENIRTTRYLHEVQVLGCLGYYKLLRILNLRNLVRKYYKQNSDYSLPSEICELFHLRYLAFDGQFRIPAGISNLRNLQTLIVDSTSYEKYYTYNANTIPFLVEIWSLPQLRHLQIGTGFLFYLPTTSEEDESFALENLQTLSLAVNFACSLDIVKAIRNVKKLVIYIRDDREDCQVKNLMHLQKLENLKLEIHQSISGFEKYRPTFPLSLKKLTLTGLKLPWEHLWIVGLLPQLQVLKLRRGAYIGGTWETSDGGFSQLRFLLIESVDLEDWITESSHFPNLQCLVIRRCSCLYEIPEVVGEIPTLEEIEVDDRNDSVVESAKEIQEYQRGCGKFTLRLRIVEAHEEKWFREGESFALKNLQTLSLAVNFACTLDIVEAIPNVKKLSILFRGRDVEEHYQLNNLVHLEKLENLKLEMHVDFPCPEKLKLTLLPPALKKLALVGLKLPWEDLRVVGSLPNLQVLKLKSLVCSGGTWETSEGEFPQLKHLVIDCTDLENWITETSHFPQLQRLVLYRCPRLYGIPDDIGEIPTLELIEIDSRYEPLVESAKQIQGDQLECGNDSLRVRIIKFKTS